MIPIALAVVRAGGVRDGETDGFAGAVMMGIAFAASLGGLGTLVGSPTNAIAAGLIEKALGLDISRSEEHTSELQSLMRISYAVFCLKKKTHTDTQLHIMRKLTN